MLLGILNKWSTKLANCQLVRDSKTDKLIVSGNGKHKEEDKRECDFQTISSELLDYMTDLKVTLATRFYKLNTQWEHFTTGFHRLEKIVHKENLDIENVRAQKRGQHKHERLLGRQAKKEEPFENKKATHIDATVSALETEFGAKKDEVYDGLGKLITAVDQIHN
jgi:hypothetical protein